MVRVTIEQMKPLAGAVTSATGEILRFEGWLGLLGVISELVDAAGRAAGRSTEDAPGR